MATLRSDTSHKANSHGESPGPTRWMTVYDGAAGADVRDAALARQLATAHPDGRSGALCGVRRLTGC